MEEGRIPGAPQEHLGAPQKHPYDLQELPISSLDPPKRSPKALTFQNFEKFVPKFRDVLEKCTEKKTEMKSGILKKTALSNDNI